MKNRILLVLLAVVLIGSCVLLVVDPIWHGTNTYGATGPVVHKYKIGEEITDLRTEISKTFYAGNATYRAEISSGILHYKNNYGNTTEEWKDINLKWDGRYLDTAPYVLSVSGKGVTFTDKKTGDYVAISSKLDFTVIPFNEGVKLQRVIQSAKDLRPALFNVETKGTSVRIYASAMDATGATIPIEYSIKDGVLTESIPRLETIEGGKIEFPITIDPGLVVQPTDKDNYMYEYADDTNYGTDSSFYVGRDSLGYRFRTLGEFDVSQIYGATIDAAYIKLYYYSYRFGNDPAGRTYKLHRLLRLDWSETESTWNNYKSGSAWTIAGCGDATSDYTTSGAVSAVVPSSFGWMTWWPKAQVQWACDNQKPVAFRVSDNTETTGYYARFYSKEYTTDTSLRPKLGVTYTVNPPVLTTDDCSGLAPTYMTGNGEILGTGGATVTRRGFCYMEGELAGWVSPTGHNDPDSKWINEANAYDEDTGTYAYAEAAGEGYYIEFTHSAIECDRVRIYAAHYAPAETDPDVDIDVYYDSGWHNIWSGVIAKSTWVTKEIGSRETVTAARVKFNEINFQGRIFEFDFYAVEPTTDDDTVYEDGTFGLGSYSLTIDDLEPETSYLVRAYAVNSEGTGYGNTVVASTTEPWIPEVDTNDCSDIGALSMQGNADITYYGGVTVTKRGFAHAEGLKYALEFDGTTSDYVEMDTFSDTFDAFTVEFWMKTSDTTNTGTPFSCSDGTNHNEILLLNYQNFNLYVEGAATGGTGVSANDGECHHIAWSWEWQDTTGAVYLYKDGIEEYSGAITPTGISITNPSFENGNPPTGWTGVGTGHTWERSSEQAKAGTYSGKMTNGNGNYAQAYQGLSNPESYRDKDVTIGACVWADTADRVRLLIGDNNGSNWQFGSSSYHTGSSSWEWLTATKTIRSDAIIVRVYVDRIDAGSAISAYSDAVIVVVGDSIGNPNPANIIIGQEQDTYGGGFQASQAFLGEIDEIRVWDDVRTQTEIITNMYSELAGSESGLVGYWKLDEGTGTTAEDSTSNNNDGNIYGTNWVYQGWDLGVDSEIIYGSSQDGDIIRGGAGTYLYHWNHEEGSVEDEKWFDIGQDWGGTFYGIYRSFPFFNTTSIPSNAIDMEGFMYLYGYVVPASTENFLVTIQNGQPTYPHDPMVAGDYNRLHYSGDGGNFDIDDWTTSGYNIITLNPTGLSWINIGGMTKLCLRSSREIAGIEPTDYEYVGAYASDTVGGEGKEPYLYLSYVVPTSEDGEFGEGEYSLTIEDLTPDTWYRVCGVAENSVGVGYGDVVAAQTLTGIPELTTFNCSNATATTLLANGNITDTNGLNPYRRGFCYFEGTEGEPTTDDSVKYEDGSFGVGVYSLTLEGLTPNTNYRVRAYAISTVATGYGNTVTCTTLAGIPTVVSVSTTNIGFNTATLTGNITDTGGSTNITRGFQWGIVTGFYSYNWSESGGFGTGAYSRNISGLSCGTTIYWRAFAAGETGTGYGSELTFNTTVCELPIITSSAATGIDATYATLHGNIIYIDGAYVTVRGFEWGLSIGNYSSNWTEEGSFGIGEFSHQITGLPPITQIFWRALAVNIAGINYSAERSFNTTLPLPGAPINLITTQTDTSSLNATWVKGSYASYTILRIKADEYPEDITDGEELYYGGDESVSFNLTYFGIDPMDAEIYNLDNRTYYIRAWSQNDRGYSLDYTQARLGAAEIIGIIFALGLCAFALWKTYWIRSLLSICIIVWGVFNMPADYKIAAPLIVIGAVLFITSVISHWRTRTQQVFKEVE